jgi:hypothetical protein
VGICDVDAVDLPRWETGEEALVTGEQCILVATRGGLHPVELEVWMGIPTTPAPGPLLFDGELCTTGKGVEVGDLVAGDGHQVQLPVGWHRLRIYADQPGNATQLRFVFGPAPDRSQAAPPTPDRRPSTRPAPRETALPLGLAWPRRGSILLLRLCAAVVLASTPALRRHLTTGRQ